MALTKDDLISILDKKLDPLLSEISTLKKELGELKQSVDHASGKYDEISKRMKDLQADNIKYAQDNKTLKKTIEVLDNKVRQLESHSNDVRQYTRRDCVEIHGIPHIQDEDTNDLVKQVGDLMEVYLDDKAISISHRLPTSKKNKAGKPSTPAIIVKFVRRDVKDRFYKSRSKLKSCTTDQILGCEVSNRIYINESLTEENRKIFNESLQFRKEKKFAFIWTSNGITYLRKDKDSKAIVVKAKEDIDKLKASYNTG